MKIARWLFFILIVGLAIWRLWPELKDLSQITKTIQNAQILWLILAVFAIAGQYFGDGWLSQILLKIAGTTVTLKDNMKIAIMDVFASHLLPLGEAGVIATSFYFYKKIGVDNQSVIFLSLLWGFLTNLMMIILLLISIILLPKLPNMPIHISQLTLYLLIIILIISPILIFKGKTIWLTIQKKIGKYHWFLEISKFTKNLSFHKNALLKNKLMIIFAVLASFIYYAGNIASLYFSFLAYGQPPSIALITFAYIMSLIASFVTLAPAGIGSSEATLVLIFLQFGVAPALTLASVLTFRIIASWLPIPVGFFSYRMMKNHPEKGKI